MPREAMNNTTQQSYKEEVMQYTKKDAIHALLFAAYVVLIALVGNTLMIIFDLTDDDGRMTFAGYLMNVGSVFLHLVPLFVILKKKGQGFRSLGLHVIGWKKALFAGLFFVILFLMLFQGLLPGLLAGWQMRSPIMIVSVIIYLLIMAVREDILYVGYIQTRIYGLIKKDFLAIGTVGSLFAVVHFPGFITFNILSGEGFGVNFWLMFVGMTLSWIIGHVLFNTLFRQFRSIIVVTLFHFSSNLAIRGDLWEYSGEHGVFYLISGGAAIGAFLLITVFLKVR